MKKLIGPIRQVLTLSQLPLKGALSDEELEVISEGGILLFGEKILKVGKWTELKKEYPEAILEELEGNFVALPGWVDCHTHLCFGGNRAKDFALRIAGKSYLEIAGAGGGIWNTVTQTRSLSVDALAQLTAQHGQRHFTEGVTTIEVKSGYGLSVAEELKMLRAIRQAQATSSADLISTCLAAHLCPKDWKGSSSDYLLEISTHLFPVLLKEKLCHRIDAFVEKSAFTTQEISPYLEKAKQLGFDLTIHADQFSTGGSELAVNLGARSADHLEASGDREIALLAQSSTVAVALPGASIGLGMAFAPARKLLDQGASLAIASDWNPGSAPMGDLLAQASILATFEKLTSAEVITGLTCRAAAALGLSDRGILTTGQFADIILFPTSDYRDILYYQGKMKPEKVWKKGKIALGTMY
ncbi:MAG: imidazolonepropionase [Bacteroidetes bacterium]|nr:imidazolonepropionase [Bacteroidota bacterium]MDA1268301.1 imidazolonepropionase [Bacteroidota bacterium]